MFHRRREQGEQIFSLMAIPNRKKIMRQPKLWDQVTKQLKACRVSTLLPKKGEKWRVHTPFFTLKKLPRAVLMCRVGKLYRAARACGNKVWAVS